MSSETDTEAIVSYLIAGGVVGYQRALARAVESHSAGLLLSQFWYWSERIPAERAGWFWKTQVEIEEETVMTRREQETARRVLRGLGILQEQRRGVPAKLWFRINRPAVMRLLKEKAGLLNGGNRHPSMSETANQERADQTRKPARSRQTNTKNTAETTPSTTAARRAAGRHLSNNLDGADAAGDPGLVKMLLARGLNRSDAYRLAKQKPGECRRQLDYLRYLPPRTNPGGWLRDAIEHGHAAPAGYREAKEREAQAERSTDLQRLRKAREAHEASAAPAYLDYLRERAGAVPAEDPDAYSAFVKWETERRARIEGAPLRPDNRARLLQEFDCEEQRLHRVSEFFSPRPDRLVLPFWEWDRALNPASFDRSAA